MSRIVFFHQIGWRNDRSKLIRHEVLHRRFVSVRTGDAEGRFVTRPLLVPQAASSVALNIEIRHVGATGDSGWVSVAVLMPEQDLVMFDFGHSECSRIVVSHSLTPVVWRSTSRHIPVSFAQLQGQYVRLEIRSRMADVFGLQFVT